MASEPLSPLAAGRVQRFAARELALPVEPLLRLQGYRDLTRIRADVRAAAATAAEAAGRLIDVQVAYRRLPIRACSAERLTLAGGASFRSAEFDKVLGSCRETVAFVLTLGERFDRETEARMQRDELVETLFLETAGWVAIEKATRRFAEHLTAEIRAESLRLTRRLAPGYFDWPLDEQAAFFGLFEGAALPVRLLESSAMLPKKSRSGLYGLAAA